MAKETRLFKIKEARSRSEVATIIQQIAEKIADGEVVLRRGSEEVVLQMPMNLILEVQVEDEEKKKKGTEHSLEIEIKWYDDDRQNAPLELG